MGLAIGLTGGIASGKSTVSTMLKEFGFEIIDADQIAKDVVQVGEKAYDKIIDNFGKEILQEDQTINRAKLGEIIFNNSEKRQLLNQIVHPAVRERMLVEKERLLTDERNSVILDIPLLFESKLTHLVDRTILVYVDEEVQLKRLMIRNQFNEQEAHARISSQMPLIEKVALADAVLTNNGTIEELREQIIELLNKWDLL